MGAYREVVSSRHLFVFYLLAHPSIIQTTIEALDDDALFGNEEEEDEDGAFVM